MSTTCDNTNDICSQNCECSTDSGCDTCECPAICSGPTTVDGPTGPTGPQGPEGSQGPKGDKGCKGDKGDKGETGCMGAMGPRGPIGPQGIRGPQGVRGDIGPQGDPGCQGPKGVRGNPGPAGPIGPRGPLGERGDTGPVGPQGPEGPEGPQGPQGIIGPEGPQGLDGPVGKIGPQGPIGPKGCQGPEGPEGPIGAQGPIGPVGDTGPAGDTGPTGPTGTFETGTPLFNAIDPNGNTESVLLGDIMSFTTNSPDIIDISVSHGSTQININGDIAPKAFVAADSLTYSAGQLVKYNDSVYLILSTPSDTTTPDISDAYALIGPNTSIVPTTYEAAKATSYTQGELILYNNKLYLVNAVPTSDSGSPDTDTATYSPLSELSVVPVTYSTTNALSYVPGEIINYNGVLYTVNDTPTSDSSTPDVDTATFSPLNDPSVVPVTYSDTSASSYIPGEIISYNSSPYLVKVSPTEASGTPDVDTTTYSPLGSSAVIPVSYTNPADAAGYIPGQLIEYNHKLYIVNSTPTEASGTPDADTITYTPVSFSLTGVNSGAGAIVNFSNGIVDWSNPLTWPIILNILQIGNIFTTLKNLFTVEGLEQALGLNSGVFTTLMNLPVVGTALSAALTPVTTALDLLLTAVNLPDGPGGMMESSGLASMDAYIGHANIGSVPAISGAQVPVLDMLAGPPYPVIISRDGVINSFSAAFQTLVSLDVSLMNGLQSAIDTAFTIAIPDILSKITILVTALESAVTTLASLGTEISLPSDVGDILQQNLVGLLNSGQVPTNLHLYAILWHGTPTAVGGNTGTINWTQVPQTLDLGLIDFAQLALVHTFIANVGDLGNAFVNTVDGLLSFLGERGIASPQPTNSPVYAASRTDLAEPINAGDYLMVQFTISGPDNTTLISGVAAPNAMASVSIQEVTAP